MIYGKAGRVLAWLKNRLHHWGNTTIGYCFRMITSLLIPCKKTKYLMAPNPCDTVNLCKAL